jgi:hypothetical protein
MMSPFKTRLGAQLVDQVTLCGVAFWCVATCFEVRWGGVIRRVIQYMQRPIDGAHPQAFSSSIM